MSTFALGLGGIGLMLVLLILRQPVWLALTMIGIGGNWVLNGLDASKFVAGTTLFDVATGYNFCVIPLFILMGEIASGTRMSAELFKAARVVLSGIRGGLAVATIVASGGFGAISGSSVATAASMARIAMPEMAHAGYRQSYSAASVAAGGSLGILIPPSIILVIYGSITETSVARLFAASMIPGIVLLLLYIGVALVIAHRGGAAPVEPAASLRDRLAALLEPWQFAALFVLTIGGIYAGIFSPAEAASVGAFGAILLGFLKRSLDFAGLVRAFQSSVVVFCTLFMIVIAATLFSNFIVQTRLPGTLLTLSQNVQLDAWAVMALIVGIYVVLGCFLEGIGMILITVPVFLPVVAGYGFDPIWFGVVVAILVELGLITPPIGMNLFIIRAQTDNLPMRQVFAGIVPFLIAPIVLVGLMFAFPELALWLPSLLY